MFSKFVIGVDSRILVVLVVAWNDEDSNILLLSILVLEPILISVSTLLLAFKKALISNSFEVAVVCKAEVVSIILFDNLHPLFRKLLFQNLL